jgi:fatty-acyl-CoA synthase
MTNRPEYFAVWLGITSIGGVVALLNTNLVGPSLAHCINIVTSNISSSPASSSDTLTAVHPTTDRFA